MSADSTGQENPVINLRMEIARKIQSILVALWKAMAFLGTFIGILYIWPDIKGLDEEFPWLGGLMPSREELLIVFALVCLVYILWIDLRPFWTRHKAESLTSFRVPGVDGSVVDWVDAAWAIIRAARKGKSPSSAVGHDKRKRDQLNWCLVLILHLSKAGELPLFVREMGEREWEPLSSHDEHSYHIHAQRRTIFRFHPRPWEEDGNQEIFDFDSIVVKMSDLKRVRKLFRSGAIQDHPAFNQVEFDPTQWPEDTEAERPQ
ncbi:MAG: hypothetical protein ABJL57_17285 [Hyphomonas sp.]|uniref:hypothetical protein n=1 Tax=Hyphomonas sp. TaxID=87 RepID=UPI003264E0A7